MSLLDAYQHGVDCALEKIGEFGSTSQSAGRTSSFKVNFTKSVSEPKNKLTAQNTPKHLSPQGAAKNKSFKAPSQPTLSGARLT